MSPRPRVSTIYLCCTSGFSQECLGGFVSINSSDPFAIPLVSPNLLNEEIDLLIVREAIKSARRFMAAPAWDGYVLGSLNNNATTDEEIDEFVRNNAVSFFHPVSTSSMSPKGAQYGVVDPDLLVKGVEGLRIVDASVIVRVLLHLGLKWRLTVFFTAQASCCSYFRPSVCHGGKGGGYHQGCVRCLIKLLYSQCHALYEQTEMLNAVGLNLGAFSHPKLERLNTKTFSRLFGDLYARGHIAMHLLRLWTSLLSRLLVLTC